MIYHVFHQSQQFIHGGDIPAMVMVMMVMAVSVNMAVATMRVDDTLPANTGYLIHMIVGNYYVYLEIGIKQRLQILFV